MNIIAMLVAAVLLTFGIVTPAAQADDRLHVVAAGDSITEGAGGGKWMSYPHQMGKMFHDQLRVENAGHTASCIAFEGCGYGPTLQQTFADDVLTKQPDVIIIDIGRNDLCHITTRQYKKAMRNLRDAGKATGARVVYGTITPPNERWPWPCEEQTAELNEWMRRRSSTIDFAAALSNKDGELRKRFDSGDGLHPNDLGYRVMARTAAAALLR